MKNHGTLWNLVKTCPKTFAQLLDTYPLSVYTEDMKRFQICMSEPLMEQLKKIAQEKGLATSDIIRRACEEYLAKQNKHE